MLWFTEASQPKSGAEVFVFSFPQEVFNHSFDSALQSLISDFLYKIEELFPVPDFKQVCCESDLANQLWI